MARFSEKVLGVYTDFTHRVGERLDEVSDHMLVRAIGFAANVGVMFFDDDPRAQASRANRQKMAWGNDAYHYSKVDGDSC